MRQRNPQQQTATQRGLRIHKQIQRYLCNKKNNLSQQMKIIVDSFVCKAYRKIRNGQLLVQYDVGSKKVDCVIRGNQQYVIIDWKTGGNYPDDFLIQAKEYASIFQSEACKGQVWFVNVDQANPIKFKFKAFDLLNQNSQIMQQEAIEIARRNQREAKAILKRRKMKSFGLKTCNFGQKHYGKTWNQIYFQDRGHLKWLIQVSDFGIQRKIMWKSFLKYKDKRSILSQ